MPHSFCKKSVFEGELGWSGLGWSSGQQFYSVNVGPTCVISINYIHQTVNHIENFVEPTTGALTQTSKLSGTSTRYRLFANAAHIDLQLTGSFVNSFGAKGTKARTFSCKLLTTCPDFTLFSKTYYKRFMSYFWGDGAPRIPLIQSCIF